MAEYIEREALKQSFCDWCNKEYENEPCEPDDCPLRNLIFNAPAAEVVPVVHGRWEEADDGDGVVCSVCREDFCTIYLETERFNYCPNCGSRMDGE